MPSLSRKPRICDVVDCCEHAEARGLCTRHYSQMRKGWTLHRRGETVPRERAPWVYEGREDELARLYGGENSK
jgi:hypothetical protein